MNYIRSDDEERFAEFLIGELRNAEIVVPETPREEIWAAISARRSMAAVDTISRWDGMVPDNVEVSNSDLDIAVPVSASIGTTGISTRGWGSQWRWGTAIAAVFLVIGVGAGWLLENRRTVDPPPADVASETTGLPSEMPTQVIAEQHFAEVDQLIATFASMETSEASRANNAQLEAEIGMWARNLLSTTQLLMDSPLGLDPHRRKLLTDVEMVLVQIAQLAPNGGTEDREITERSIEESHVRERLQKVTPAPETSTKKAYENQRGL